MFDLLIKVRLFRFVMYFYILSPIEVCKGSGSLARLARRILMFFIFDFGKNISLNLHLYQFFVFCFYLFFIFRDAKIIYNI